MSSIEDDQASEKTHLKATRRRGDALTNAIRKATITALKEDGYNDTTFGNVAKRARTSRSVLYRRYRSRTHMIADALLTQIPSPESALATSGSVRDDLRKLLEGIAVAHLLFDPEITRKIVGEADSALVEEITGVRFKPFVESLRHFLKLARERGEMGSAIIPPLAMYTPISMLRAEAIQRPLTPEFLDSLVDDVIMPLFVTLSNRTEDEMTPHQPRQSTELSAENLSLMWQLSFQSSD